MSKWSFSENFYWKNNFPQCGGPNQSPINLDSEIIQKCETLCNFDTFYESSKCYVTYINNLIQLNYDKGSYLKFQDILYELKNITIHAPSLHSIDGEKYDLEICLIHSLNSDESDTNGIILSRMFQKGPHYGNPENFINQFINDLPRVEVSNEMEINVSNNWNVNMLLPKNKSYFMYEGSLPFPPCTEQYKVFVYEDIGSIGETNINIFQNNISDSFRPIQLLNNRTIFYIADKGKVKKTKGISPKQLKQVDAISKANVEIFKSKFEDRDISVHVIKKLTDEVIKSGLYGVFQSPSSLLGSEYNHCYEEGINKGKRLLKKLQIRNESTSLESHRLKKGKIDTRRIYASDFIEDIFKRIDRSNYKPLSIHLSIDGSGSMNGEKWNSTLINAIALGYVSLNVDNIDLVITIRTSGDLEGKHNHVPLLIFCFDSKVNKAHDLRKITNYRLTGSTPEGLCLDALNKFIPQSSYYLDSYLINMSDGMPNFRAKNGSEYVREEAYAHTAGVVNKVKKKNVKLLSYFISKNKNKYKTEASECFKQMYGRNSRFVDVDNINQITQTLNKLFLSENMVS